MYCARTVGEDCLTAYLLPACPALRTNASVPTAYDDTWLDTAAAASDLCSTDCVRALCRVAE